MVRPRTKLPGKLDFQSLPATVRDAIVVCKLLGQQYLWVDRFCILQDDEDDKAIQIEAMSAVFSRASLVIVAASGDGVTNGLSGISRRRQGQFYKDISNIQVNLQLPFLWDLVGPSIWDSRGWTYQEAMLSARKIFFTDAQVFFECTVGINHEEHLAYSTFDPSTHKMNRKQEYSTLTSTLEYGLPRLIETQLHRPQHLWDRTELRWAAYARHVQRYRQRSLRHKSDILNAFMGILTALYSNEKQYYGVPLPEFDLTMLWEPSSVHHRLAPKDTVAVTHDPPIEFPSWTWASSSSEVSFSNIERNFRGSLCLWFKPGSQSDLEPIIATSDSVEVFKASEDETKVSLALAIAHGLIEIYQNKESMAWIELNFDDLHHAIDGKWPAYSDFWMEIFGQDESLDRAKQQLTQALGAPLTAGMLATRTQVAKVNIIDQKPSSLIPVGGNERAIGRVFDNSDQIRNLMRLGVPAFDCMALSISDVSSWNILSGYGKVSPEDSFTDRDGKTLKRVPVVNVLVLRRDKGCCFRIGIGQVYLKQWIDLGARFETIVLA
ncbi:MAG: hypothetical protein M1820_004310 [Bogoriella megaspora]|nr:MAG: hypothetical protein M1820_004310 [Bogoriella megaspora]